MPERLSHRFFEPLRYYVHDAKYAQEYLVDLAVKPHGACGCKEFHFQVTTHKRRTTCVHIDYLIAFLTSIKKVDGPSFKGT